ncbi:hypothetical protein C2845_PM15G12410 [Panicum miliaceum]|uniref:Uncharacterized protein n=1 Tax=Panicum miliaceum TaxID=4540 RepID=A0A3L6Q5E8_PANMI|nr:hypothetical protein C2845_PM15G12410 [Panicum miliaceum]
MNYGRRFMRFFDAGPRAFGCLRYLHIQCVALSINDMANVLEKCNKLLYLSLKMCDFGSESALKMEHPQLTILELSYWKCASVQLICLPSLVQLTCEIWVQPEAPKLAGPWLQNLQFLYLRRIHEECDLDWTLFFLQAAPLLKRMIVEILYRLSKVWDHTSCAHEEDEPKEFTELCQLLYQKKGDSLTWDAPDDLKHYCLKELIVNGYQIEEKFMRYTRRVVEAAVNLELLIGCKKYKLYISCIRLFNWQFKECPVI